MHGVCHTSTCVVVDDSLPVWRVFRPFVPEELGCNVIQLRDRAFMGGKWIYESQKSHTHHKTLSRHIKVMGSKVALRVTPTFLRILNNHDKAVLLVYKNQNLTVAFELYLESQRLFCEFSQLDVKKKSAQIVFSIF